MNLLSVAKFGADFTIIMFLIAGILGFRAQPFDNKKLRFFLFYIVFTIISSSILFVTRRLGTNIYLSYIITPIYLILLTIFFLPEKKDVKQRTLILILMGIGLALNIYEATALKGGINQYNSIANTYISIFLGGLALRGLIKLRYNESVINLASETTFWIFVAIAIKNLGNLITTAFYRVVQGVDNDQLLNMVVTSMVVNYIGIVLYWIAFVKAKKNPSSNSPKLAT